MALSIIRLKEMVGNVRSNSHPIKFFLGYFLLNTHLCTLFKFRIENCIFRFYPSKLSWLLWTNPDGYDNELNFLKKYLKLGDVVVDIGANIGVITLSSSSFVGQGGIVYSFEPNPKTFEYLKGNVDENRFSNIRLYQLAVGEKSAVTNFIDDSSDDLSNSISLENINSGNNPLIQVQPLDEIIPNSVRIHLLKVDVEGFEIFVLKGAEKCLSMTDCIYIESYEAHFNKYGYSSLDLFNYMRLKGFKLLKISEENTLHEISPDYLSLTCENVIAVKNIDTFIEKTTYQIKMSDRQPDENLRK
jgi:FkbM family methyltransferase